MFVLPEEVENKYGQFDAESFMYTWLEKNKESDEGRERKKLYNHALSLQRANENLHEIETAQTQLKDHREFPGTS